jgi:siroheme synthase (precorrin-2 oxidase/ferrochelatase)
MEVREMAKKKVSKKRVRTKRELVYSDANTEAYASKILSEVDSIITPALQEMAPHRGDLSTFRRQLIIQMGGAFSQIRDYTTEMRKEQKEERKAARKATQKARLEKRREALMEKAAAFDAKIAERQASYVKKAVELDEKIANA